MTTAEYMPHSDAPKSWFARAENWLDQKGRVAWIASMVLGFIFFWPIGFALLIYMIWNKKMSKTKCYSTFRSHTVMKSSGNSAFDAYKLDTIQRLQDEQENFEAFLKRLRDAKDKAEFDDFLADREKENA